MCQPPIPSPSPPHPLALGNHKSVLSVCECVFYAYSTSPWTGLKFPKVHRTGHAGERALSSGLCHYHPWFPLASMWIPKNLVLRPPHLPTHPPVCSQPATSSLCWGIYQRLFTIAPDAPLLPHPQLVPNQSHRQEAGFSLLPMLL